MKEQVLDHLSKTMAYLWTWREKIMEQNLHLLMVMGDSKGWIMHRKSGM